MIDTTPNQNRCELEKIKDYIGRGNFKLVGDIVEFGTFTGRSTRNLSSQFPDKKVYTIDHFKGLELTNKNIPKGSDWVESAFAIGNPLYKNIDSIPKTIEEVKERLKDCLNVQMIIEDVHKLKNPSEYGISKISICNIDVDIYEPTVSALEFLTKCEWSEVFIRFDDWHGGEPEYDQHERLAFSEWIQKYKYDYQITHGGYIGGVYVKR
jgi:hypothetical protein